MVIKKGKCWIASVDIFIPDLNWGANGQLARWNFVAEVSTWHSQHRVALSGGIYTSEVVTNMASRRLAILLEVFVRQTLPVDFYWSINCWVFTS